MTTLTLNQYFSTLSEDEYHKFLNTLSVKIGYLVSNCTPVRVRLNNENLHWFSDLERESMNGRFIQVYENTKDYNEALLVAFYEELPRYPIPTPATVTNSQGGRQSHIVRGWTCLPYEALQEVVEVLYNGEQKYTKNNWRRISHRDHVEHAFAHIAAYATDNNREDLVNATCRLLFALTIEGDCNEPYDS